MSGKSPGLKSHPKVLADEICGRIRGNKVGINYIDIKT